MAADIGTVQLSDEQIAQVIMTVNQGEIQQGQLAQQQATRSEVQQFAAQMVQDHTAANQQLQTGLQNLAMTPQESPLSQQLAAEANQLLATLRTANAGEDFDRAYMDSQVAEHAKVLFLMDTVLLLQTQRAELRQLARTARTQVQQHLNDAASIQKSIPAPQQ